MSFPVATNNLLKERDQVSLSTSHGGRTGVNHTQNFTVETVVSEGFYC